MHCYSSHVGTPSGTSVAVSVVRAGDEDWYKLSESVRKTLYPRMSKETMQEAQRRS